MFYKSRLMLFAILVVIVGAASAQSVGPDGYADAGLSSRSTSGDAKTRRLIAYFTQWGIYSDYLVKNIVTSGSAAKLSHINYAFGQVAPATSQPGSPVTCQSGDP